MSKNNIINNENKKIIELLYSPETFIEINSLEKNEFVFYESKLISVSEHLDIDNVFISTIERDNVPGVDCFERIIIVNKDKHVFEFLSMLEGDRIFGWKIVIFNNHEKYDIKEICAIYVLTKERFMILFFYFDESFTNIINKFNFLYKLQDERYKELYEEYSLISTLNEIDSDEVVNFIKRKYLSIHKEYCFAINILERIKDFQEHKNTFLKRRVKEHNKKIKKLTSLEYKKKFKPHLLKHESSI